MKLRITALAKAAFATALLVSAYGCGTSEDGSEGLGNGGNGSSSSNLGGSYNITAMVSDISVDLNNDGILSTDLLTEVDPAVFSTEVPELVIKPVLYNNQLEEMMSFYLPHSNITSSTPNNPAAVKFTRSGLGYVYEFDKQTQKISIESNNNSSQPGTYGKMLSVEVAGPNKLKAVFIKNYFDFSVSNWRLLTITCMYVRA